LNILVMLGWRDMRVTTVTSGCLTSRWLR